MDNKTENTKAAKKVKAAVVSISDFLKALKSPSSCASILEEQYEKRFTQVRYLNEKKVRASENFNATYLDLEATDREGKSLTVILVTDVNVDENGEVVAPNKDKINFNYDKLSRDREMLALFNEDVLGSEIKSMRVKQRQKVMSTPIMVEDDMGNQYTIGLINDEVVDEYTWKKDE